MYTVDDCRYKGNGKEENIVKTAYRGKGKRIVINKRYPSKMEALIDLYQNENAKEKGTEVNIEWQ